VQPSRTSSEEEEDEEEYEECDIKAWNVRHKICSSGVRFSPVLKKETIPFKQCPRFVLVFILLLFPFFFFFIIFILGERPFSSKPADLHRGVRVLTLTRS